MLSFPLCSQNAVQTLEGNGFMYKENDEVDGSPYLLDDWSSAYLTDIYGDTISGLKINIDGEFNKVIAQIAEDKYMSINKNNYRYLDIQLEDGYQKRYENLAPYRNPDFYEIVYAGDKLSLYKKQLAIKRRNNPSRNSYAQVNYLYRYASKTEYLILKNEELIPVKRKEKDILKAIDLKDLKTYIKENKLKVSKDEDLKTIFKRANEILPNP